MPLCMGSNGSIRSKVPVVKFLRNSWNHWNELNLWNSSRRKGAAFEKEQRC